LLQRLRVEVRGWNHSWHRHGRRVGQRLPPGDHCPAEGGNKCRFEKVSAARFAILASALMHSLLVISVLALFTLLWAALATAQHVRRARRRQRRLREFTADQQGRLLVPREPYAPAMRFRDPLEPSAATAAVPFASVRSRTIDQPAADQPAADQSAAPTTDNDQTVVTAVAEDFVQPPQADEPFLEAETFAAQETFAAPKPAELEPLLEVESLVASEVCVEPDVVSSDASAEEVASVAAETWSEPETAEAREPESPLPDLTPAMPPRSSHGLGVKAVRPVVRADWAFFNKDMGDLSDPYETPRHRPGRQEPAAAQQRETA
jgi:hypothetical protein